MGRGPEKYAGRDYHKKYGKNIDFRSIVLCWAINFCVAGCVFIASWFAFGSVIVTILYTLSAWTVTLTLSVVYWLSWITNRLGTTRNVKMAASSIVLLSYIVGLVIILETFMSIMNIAQV